MECPSFTAEIEIIGVNPFVYIPETVLEELFLKSGKRNGKIPVKMRIDGHEFVQTLVRYSGAWRLYLNTPMRKAAGKEVGDTAVFELWFDPEERVIAMHPELVRALNENQEAKAVFDNLAPSLQKEIVRYISFLKSPETIERNVHKAIAFLLGKGRFIGRDRP